MVVVSVLALLTMRVFILSGEVKVVVLMVVMQSKWKKSNAGRRATAFQTSQHSASFLVTPVNA